MSKYLSATRITLPPSVKTEEVFEPLRPRVVQQHEGALLFEDQVALRICGERRRVQFVRLDLDLALRSSVSILFYPFEFSFSFYFLSEHDVSLFCSWAHLPANESRYYQCRISVAPSHFETGYVSLFFVQYTCNMPG